MSFENLKNKHMKKIRKILIICFVDGHIEYYKRLYDVFSRHNIETTFAGSAQLCAELASLGISNCLPNKRKRFFRHYVKHLKQIKQADFIIFDEPYQYDQFLTLFIPLKTKTILTIHNARQWTAHRKPGTGNILKNLAVSLAKTVSKPAAFITVNLNAKKFIQEHTGKQDVFFIPFGKKRSFEKTENKKSNDIRIVIPGMVSDKRRDYNIPAEAIKYTETNRNDKKISLVLLGKIKNQESQALVDKIKEAAKTKDINITSYKRFIPQHEFENALKNCDFILSNNYTQIKMQYGVTEIYGETKESGVFSAALNYSKPLIIPAEQKMPEAYEQCTIKYDNAQDLGTILSKIAKKEITPESFEQKMAEAHKTFEQIITQNEKALIAFFTKLMSFNSILLS